MNQTMVNQFLNPSIANPTHETMREAADLITSGTFHSYPNMHIVLSHGGGPLPCTTTLATDLLDGIGLTKQSANECFQQARSLMF